MGFDPNEARDWHGRWGDGGSGGDSAGKIAEQLQADPTIAYHVTFSRNRDSILADGLTLQRSSNSKNVWLYPTLQQAENHRNHFSGGKYMDTSTTPTTFKDVTYDIYAVDTKGIRRTKSDPHKIAAGSGGVAVKVDITPDRLILLDVPDPAMSTAVSPGSDESAGVIVDQLQQLTARRHGRGK